MTAYTVLSTPNRNRHKNKMSDKLRTDIEVHAREWAICLKMRQYTGELVVSDDDLYEIARVPRRDLQSPHCTQNTYLGLLVLAVNCVYYLNDEQG